MLLLCEGKQSNLYLHGVRSQPESDLVPLHESVLDV